MTTKYIFEPYDDALPALFVAEKRRLLAKIPSIQIEHVGSTAVPGLGGKGIIDIAILARQEDLASVSDALEQLGYTFKPAYSTSERLYFITYLPDPIKGTRRYHIHLTYPGSSIWQELTHLRDYLIAHPQARQEYAALKKQAIASQQEGQDYRMAKDPFLKNILHKIAPL